MFSERHSSPQIFNQRHRTFALILATTWYASAALPVLAGRPATPAELPTPVASGNKPASIDLIAAASAPQTAAADQINPAPVETASPETAVAASPSSAPAPRVAPSESVTINLINRLVERGVLTKDDSRELMKQAEQDAAEARAQAAAAQEAAVQAAVTQAIAAAQSVAASAPAPELPSSPDDVRVTYIPETVKAQMREEIKQDVMAQAREENWAAPRLFPEWTARIRFFGDVRMRYEGDFFPGGNDNTGAFPNFNAINTGAPFNVAGTEFSPQINVDQDRQRFRLRARVGLEADLGEGFSAGLRIATGENNTPTSTNQSLGLANQGQGGNFSKYALWLDRAFLKYEIGGLPTKDLAISVGRFDNPFFSSEMIWDEDVGFDGAALQARYEVLPGFTPFLNLGAFIVFNTDFNFATNRPDKFASEDKYLYAGQLGFDWTFHKDWELKLAGAYYYFDNIEGRLSDPFVPLSPNDNGNTDDTRPSFAQKGNTYMALRNITPSPLNNFGTINQWQYFGLATPFHELALTGRLDYNGWEPFQVSLSGEFVKNLAFDKGAINRKAVNNRGADRNGLLGSFDGGDNAWIVGLRVGKPALEKRWDWAVGANYRYVESDAVVDAFTDSDFGGGGTNLKGYTLYGALAVSPRVWFGLRWMSASEVAGPQYREDIIQLDLNGKF
ncbi:putative porin [Verrucomicrobiota bacterium sgz303538]